MKCDGISKEMPDKALYQSMWKFALYAAIATRPDIAQAVEAVSKFCAQLSEVYFTAVKF